ncbi:MAG: hypothetical protein LUG98_05475 [Tannerellaceae bacterium]|nr:hypothetical protein [Tannerellaceae bacterium]
MEEEHVEQMDVTTHATPEKELHSLSAIDLAAFLGTPIASGWLMKENYRAMGEPEEGKKVLILGIVSTILTLACVLALPEEIVENIPNSLIPLIYTIGVHIWAKRVQGEVLKHHYNFYSRWRAAGIGILCSIVLFIGAILIIVGLDALGIVEL